MENERKTWAKCMDFSSFSEIFPLRNTGKYAIQKIFMSIYFVCAIFFSECKEQTKAFKELYRSEVVWKYHQSKCSILNL